MLVELSFGPLPRLSHGAAEMCTLGYFFRRHVSSVFHRKTTRVSCHVPTTPTVEVFPCRRVSHFIAIDLLGMCLCVRRRPCTD